LDYKPRTIAFSILKLNTFGGTIEEASVNMTKTFEFEMTPISRVVNKDFQVINTRKMVPKKRTPECDPKLFERASKEVMSIIRNLTRSAFAYSDADVVNLHYKVRQTI